MLYNALPLQEHGIKINHPASFVIQLNGAKGHLKAKCKSPSGAEIDCVITEIDEGELSVMAIYLLLSITTINLKIKLRSDKTIVAMEY